MLGQALARPRPYRYRPTIPTVERNPECDQNLIIEHECHHHIDLILRDPAAVTVNVLFFDPRAADISQRLGRPGQALLYGILEALRRGCADLRHFGD